MKYVEAQEQSASTQEAKTFLRSVVNISEREAENSRDKTWQDLSGKKKWLHWEEVIKVVKQQRDDYESETEAKLRAKESQNYAILLIYTMIPPGRGEEYRTLKVHMCDSATEESHRGKSLTNVLHISQDGSTAKLQIGKYKTNSYMGQQTIDISGIDPLVPHLLDYIQVDRQVLLQGKKDHHFLFMVSIMLETKYAQLQGCSHIFTLFSCSDTE